MKPCVTCGEIKKSSEFTRFRPKPGIQYLRKECRECRNPRIAAQTKARRLARPHAYGYKATRKYKLKRLYGITEDIYTKMYDDQNGLCAICDDSHNHTMGKTECRFAVDHDRKTGAVRGLLCTNCNMGIGNLRDDLAILERAIAYLRSGKDYRP